MPDKLLPFWMTRREADAVLMAVARAVAPRSKPITPTEAMKAIAKKVDKDDDLRSAAECLKRTGED